jgi:hypothetical protein
MIVLKLTRKPADFPLNIFAPGTSLGPVALHVSGRPTTKVANRGKPSRTTTTIQLKRLKSSQKSGLEKFNQYIDVRGGELLLQLFGFLAEGIDV